MTKLTRSWRAADPLSVKLGVTDDEIAEALGVAINLNAGAAITYNTHVLDAIDKLKQA